MAGEEQKPPKKSTYPETDSKYRAWLGVPPWVFQAYVPNHLSHRSLAEEEAPKDRRLPYRLLNSSPSTGTTSSLPSKAPPPTAPATAKSSKPP